MINKKLLYATYREPIEAVKFFGQHFAKPVGQPAPPKWNAR
jgi:hypothetical protein